MLKIGTRTSPLALAQTQIVVDKIKYIYPHLCQPGAIEIVPMETRGDKILDKSLSELGGKGLFTKELEDSLLDGRIDCAVHSFKDMSVRIHDDFAIGAILERDDPEDVFLSHKYSCLEGLPEGAVIGTASLRRKAIIEHYYPHIQVQLIRGNVGTRIEKMESGGFCGIILAKAGINRLKIQENIKQVLPIEKFIPSPAQGVLVVEYAKKNAHICELLKPLNHSPTALVCTLERLFLEALEGSCKTPLAAFIEQKNDVYDFSYMYVLKDGTFIKETVRDIQKTDLQGVVMDTAAALKKMS